jgi:hypothetical protein
MLAGILLRNLGVVAAALAGVAACSGRGLADAGDATDACANLPPVAVQFAAAYVGAFDCFRHSGGCLPDGGIGKSCGFASNYQQPNLAVEWSDGSTASEAYTSGGGVGLVNFNASSSESVCVNVSCCSFHVSGPSTYTFGDGGLSFTFYPGISLGANVGGSINGTALTPDQFACIAALRPFVFCGVSDAGACVETSWTPP